MLENCLSGSEGGGALLSLPLSLLSGASSGSTLNRPAKVGLNDLSQLQLSG